MSPRYGSPAWLVLAALEDAGTCPTDPVQLWRSLAAPLHRQAPPRWTEREHASLVQQLCDAGLAAALPDGRLVAVAHAHPSQLADARRAA